MSTILSRVIMAGLLLLSYGLSQPASAEVIPESLLPSPSVAEAELSIEPSHQPVTWMNGAVSLVGGETTTSLQQYEYAKQQNLSIMETEATYQHAILRGYFVPLTSPYLVVLAKREYVLPSTAKFVHELAAAYYETGCGQLVVTSAGRLTTERPTNGSPYSVHPAGMAVDVRTKYIPPECADWLRAYISEREGKLEVDGTQEYHPEHLHVVVPIKSPPPVILAVGY